MVEPSHIDEQNPVEQEEEQKGEPTSLIDTTEAPFAETPVKRKHFWAGTKLPSIGSIITVFSYVGYRDDIKQLLYLLSKSGQVFFDQHLDNLATQETWRV